MRIRLSLLWSLAFLAILFFLACPANAQFSGNIQGVVSDPSGGAVAQAKVVLVSLSTQVTAATTTDPSGQYRFLSLAPGPYKISVEASGFSKLETTTSLGTNQNLTLDISVKVGAAAETVTVTGENPLVNTADTRNQTTLETKELSDL